MLPTGKTVPAYSWSALSVRYGSSRSIWWTRRIWNGGRSTKVSDRFHASEPFEFPAVSRLDETKSTHLHGTQHHAANVG